MSWLKPGELGKDQDVSTPLHAACAAAGLDPTGARLLHDRANAVHHLPAADAVVRLRRLHDAPAGLQRLATSVHICQWLDHNGFPAIPPLPIEPVAVTGGWVATFWRYIPHDPAHTATVQDLATILRELHTLPRPPIDLPTTNPLGTLLTDLDHYEHHLAPHHHTWLRNQAHHIRAAYPAATADLNHGLVHGDARTGNLLHDGHRWLLGDWDGAAHGPRPHDLVPALVGVHRFGSPRTRWTDLCHAYGTDPDLDQHPGVQLLVRARELRSLAAYIRTAHRPDIHHELTRRLHNLIDGQATIWREL